jgi:hypothetical protein
MRARGDSLGELCEAAEPVAPWPCLVHGVHADHELLAGAFSGGVERVERAFAADREGDSQRLGEPRPWIGLAAELMAEDNAGKGTVG